VNAKPGDTSKMCSKCREVKPLGEFSKNGWEPDGLNHYCRPCAVEHVRQWQKKNKRRKRIYLRQYHLDHREELNRKKREWYWTNRDEIQARRIVRRTGKNGPLTGNDLKELFVKQSGRCYYCGVLLYQTKWEVDHMLPVSRGGGDSIDNLCVACVPCNHRKFTKTVAEFMEVLNNG
jgi:5-methylcytosine-specific restriction endonuclease McrA